MTESGWITILSGIRSRGRSIGDWLNLMSVLSISIVDLLANLLGESKLNSLASRSSKLGDALLGSLGGVFNLWDSDALLLSEVLTADSWERDWLVDTGLDWLRVGNLNSWLNDSHYGDIVASLLGNFLAIVVSVAISVSMSVALRCRLADSHHLDLALLGEGNLNSLGVCSLHPLLVRVGADLVINLLNALGTDGTGDWVALLFVYNFLNSELNRVAHCLKSWCADLGSFNDVMD